MNVRRRELVFVVLALGLGSVLAVGCGPPVSIDGGPGTDTSMMGTDSSMMGTDSSMMGTDSSMMGTDAGGTIWNVPPPMGTYQDILDTEPNDTPDTASVAGTIDFSGYWGTSFVGVPNTLGGADVVDYVSFATGMTPGDTIQLPIFPCWTPAVDLIDWWVYEVTPGAPLVEVTSSITPDTACEGSFTIDLPGGTWYLLELRTPASAIPAPAGTEYFW